MGDRNIEYTDTFGMSTFQREITNHLGEPFWQALTRDAVLPRMETEASCKCANMVAFMARFDQLADRQTANTVFSAVRHGLKPSQCAWAREKFLAIGNLDAFLAQSIQEGVADFEKRCLEQTDFYGQPITREVLEFIKANPGMLSGIRKGNKLYFSAFPAQMLRYLQTDDPRMKAYYACHCPFAKESILTGNPVSSTLCYCSLGHIQNFWEAVFDEPLHGEVLTSALRGDALCTYVVEIPQDIMATYV